MPVPNQFANVTTSIPLSQLDANFNTPITLGNTAIQLGNTVTTLNNMTLANVTVSSGNVTITNVSVTTANVTTANITTAIIGTANVTTANVTTGIIGTANVTTGNITTAVITTANVATANITTSQILNYGTANSVVYLNSSKAETANTGLQFDGTNLGLGVTPSAWATLGPVIQMGSYGAYIAAQSNSEIVRVGSNNYYNAGFKYVTNGYASFYSQSVGEHIWYTAPSGTAGNAISFTQAMTLNASGNLGIGTSSPNTKLQVNGNAVIGNGTIGAPASGYQLRVTNDGSEYYDFGRSSSTGYFTINASQASPYRGFIWAYGGTSQMTLDASGRLLIGTTTSGSAGGIMQTINGSTSAYTQYNVGTSGGGVVGSEGTGVIFYTYTGNLGSETYTERARITSAGEFWVAGTTDRGAYNIQCNGTGVWGAGAYVNGSDARIKENIAPIASGLDVVTKLNPVTYRYKEDWSKDQSIQTGFIAQELLVAMEGENYVDGIVQQGGSEGYYSVAYQNIIPLLTKAIQEQQAMIDELKAKVAALENA